MMQPRNLVTLRERIASRNEEQRRQALIDRIAEAERDALAARLRRAHQLGMTAEPDYLKPGFWLTRHAIVCGGHDRMVTNLTSSTSCTCSEFGIFHRCACQALVIDLITESQECAA
jgi:hypothetical protein